ncbi:MAG: SH3 domain-containing protein, partial [Blastochloris sp.]|nr:SH3 domain-containing protein [Blastochloris sp.]
MTVLVEARRGDRTVSADEVVSIIQPMFIEAFTATPTRLYINVYTPLTVSWSVPGAATTSLRGLEAFVATSIQATPLRDLYGEQAALDSIVGYTTGALTLTLLAQDSDGNQLTDVVMIEAVESRCAPVGGAAQLYSGPGDGFQVIGTVPEASAVIVDAQDPTGLWLRVLVSGTEGWGRIDSFICDGFDPAALRKEFDIPTPVPVTTTPSPSATPAVLPTTT